MYLIVGIDPGTTTAIAILNFDGELLSLMSSKDIGLSGAIQHIINQGRASLIATDVNPCPDFVSSVATKLGAKVFTPEESLHVQDKNLITKEYDPRDCHQRDALAAALTAFHYTRKKFSGTNMELDEEMKHLILQGVNIKKITENREKAKEEEQERLSNIHTEKKLPEKKPRIIEEKELKELERKNSYLKEKIEEDEKEIAKLTILQKKIKEDYSLESRKEEEIAKRERTIRNLENLLKDTNEKIERFEDLREVWLRIAKKEIMAVTVFPDISDFVLMKKKVKEDDIEKLSGVKIVFTDDDSSIKHLTNKGISVGNPRYVDEVYEFHYITKKNLELLMNEKKKRDFSLDSLVESYRKARE